MAFNPNSSFWNNSSVLSEDYNRLQEKLVPTSGKCDTLEGELLRASSRIYYDYYNNGFGNNWSGAYNFLDLYLGLKASEQKLLKRYSIGKICKRTNVMYTENDEVATALEEIGERVVRYVLEIEKVGFTPNTIDMFDV